MAKSPTTLAATSAWEPFRQAPTHRVLLDQIGLNHGNLGSNRSPMLTGSYLYLPGTASNYAKAPDSASLSITGDIDIRMKCAAVDWTPAAHAHLVAKRVDYRLRLQTNGFLFWQWTQADTTAKNALSTVALTLTDGSTKWIRVTHDVDNGSTQNAVRFYTSDDGSVWTQLGATVTAAGVTNFQDSTDTLNVGSADGGTEMWNGRVYSAEVRSGIDGTIVASPDFTAQTIGTTSFTDTQGNVWTLNEAAVDTAEPAISTGILTFDGGDYIQVQDHTTLAFGAALSAFAVVKAASQASKAVAAQFDTNALRSWWMGTDATGAKLRVLISADGGATNYKDYTSSVTAFDSTAHTVAFTFSAGTLKLYIDGVEDVSVTKTTDGTVASLFDSTSLLTLGASLATAVVGSFLTGAVAAVTLLPTALSASDLGELHDYYRNTLADYGVYPPQRAGLGTGTITITAPVTWQLFQRTAAGTKSVTVTGTYTGSPTTIEYQWAGGAWATLVASPAGGAFSSAVTLPSGQGTLNLRFSNDTNTTASVSFVGVGDLFACAGQSNMVGPLGAGPSTNRSYSHPTLKAINFTNAYTWAELIDPYDNNTGQVDAVSSDSAGPSFVPLLATELMAQLGYPVGFVPCARSGTPISPNWLPGADHSDRTTLYGSMNYRIGQVGGCKVVLWWQGESEAAASTPRATYKGYLDTLANAVGSDRGVKLMPAKLQNCTDATVVDDPTALANIQNAITDAWASNSNVVRGPDLSDLTTTDGFHLATNALLQTAADRWFGAIYPALYLSGGGPARLSLGIGLGFF